MTQTSAPAPAADDVLRGLRSVAAAVQRDGRDRAKRVRIVARLIAAQRTCMGLPETRGAVSIVQASRRALEAGDIPNCLAGLAYAERQITIMGEVAPCAR